MENVLEIPLINITASPTNPRKYFDKQEMKDLQASIETHGVLQPIIVRAIAEPVNPLHQFEIVAGERRYRASVALEYETIPAIVYELNDESAMEIQVIENLQRADVHPLDEAEGFAQLVEKNGLTIKQVAERVGKSHTYVAQHIQLTNLIKPMKKFFWADGMTVTHAIHIARLDEAGQKTVLAWIGDDAKIRSVSSLVEIIERRVMLDLAKASWKKDDAELDTKAGACTMCAKRTGFDAALFSDMAKVDMCLDGKCFAGKGKAFVAAKLVEAEENEEVIVKISTEYNCGVKNTLGRSEYQHAKKSDPKAHKAMVVDGDGLGTVAYITTAAVVGEHTERTPEEKIAAAQVRVTNQKNEIMRKTRLAAITAITAKVNTKLSFDDAQLIASALYACLSNHDKKVFIEEILVTDEKAFAKTAPKTEFEVNKLLVGMALALSVDPYREESKKALDAAATRHKVDVKKLKADVAEANPIKYPKAYVGSDAPKVEAKKAA